MSRVLLVVAHPDDEVLSAGGTIAKHVRRGHEVAVLILSEGVTARYSSDRLALVQKQAKEVAAILGVSHLQLLDLPDQRLDTLAISDVAAPIEEAIAVIRPDIVYTHWVADVNRDHEVVAEATMVATRPYAAPCVRQLLMFESASAGWGASHLLHYPFNPSVFEDISTTIDLKVQALELYEREVRDFPHPRSPEGLRARAAYWGTKVGLSAAEAFSPVRILN